MVRYIVYQLPVNLLRPALNLEPSLQVPTLTHLLTHLLTYLLTHSLTHLLTHLPGGIDQTLTVSGRIDEGKCIFEAKEVKIGTIGTHYHSPTYSLT